MKMPKEFGYYINAGIVIKSSPNIQRAKFLVSESENSLEGLKERIENKIRN